MINELVSSLVCWFEECNPFVI